MLLEDIVVAGRVCASCAMGGVSVVASQLLLLSDLLLKVLELLLLPHADQLVTKLVEDDAFLSISFRRCHG